MADSPVAYWRMDEASGTSMVDATGNGRTGTYAGSPTLGTISLLPTEGKTAVAFDGTNDTSSVTSHTSLNSTTGGFTVECWIKIDVPTADKYQVIIDKTGGTQDNKQWLIIWDNRTSQGSPLRLRAQNGFTSAGTITVDWGGATARDALAAGGHLVVVWNGTNTKIYWNGVQVVSGTGQVGEVANTRAVNIGSLNGSSYWFDGTLDEIAIYQSALSAARVLAHYKGNTVAVTADGQHNAFPAIALCKDRSLLLGYRKATAHLGVNGTLVSKRSTDFGSTWGSEVSVASLSGKDLRDPMFTTSGSDLWLSYFAYDKDASVGISIRFQKSTDNGVTWDSARVITSAFSVSSACSAPVLDLGGGVMIMPVYGIDSTKYLAKLLRSTDSGDTWSVYSTIATNAGKDYTEPFIIKLADDSLLATIRCDTDSIIYTSTSSDDGATWSALASGVTVASGRPSMILNSDSVIRMAYRGTPTTTRLVQQAQSVNSGSTWTSKPTFGSGNGIYTYAQWIEAYGFMAIAWSEEPVGGYTGSVSDMFFRMTKVWAVGDSPIAISSSSAATIVGEIKVYGESPVEIETSSTSAIVTVGISPIDIGSSSHITENYLYTSGMSPIEIQTTSVAFLGADLVSYIGEETDLLVPILLTGRLEPEFPPPVPPIDFEGIADPLVAPTCVASNTADGHLLDGTYRYSYAGWAGDIGQTTAPSPWSEEVVLTVNDTVTLTYPAIEGADGYLVYRWKVI
jgi:hypothetical protein